jgi:predicted dehydrogenase
MHNMLRVGIIGANARGGWAQDSHVPAVQGLAGLSLAAVATNSQETADEAAHVFGVNKAYPNGLALIADPDIDIVTVATRVPDHRALVLSALAAGKHVYSEWPLGIGTTESQEMEKAARVADVHTAIGLQLRESPAVHHARDLIASGAIGRVLGVSAFSATAGFGSEVPDPYLYLEDPANFANLVTIQGAHTLDVAIALGGRPASLSGLASRQFPEIRSGEDREIRSRETFDHLLVQASLGSGAPIAVEVAGGRSPDTPFRIDVVGESGALQLRGAAARGLQSGRATLLLDGSSVAIDEGDIANMPDAAVNVAGVYRRLRDDIARSNRSVAGFDHAVRLTRLVEDVLTSSATGRRVEARDWPS